MDVLPHGGVHVGEGFFDKGFWIGLWVEDGEDGGAGAGHHSGRGLGLGLEVSFKLC